MPDPEAMKTIQTLIRNAETLAALGALCGARAGEKEANEAISSKLVLSTPRSAKSASAVSIIRLRVARVSLRKVCCSIGLIGERALFHKTSGRRQRVTAQRGYGEDKSERQAAKN